MEENKNDINVVKSVVSLQIKKSKVRLELHNKGLLKNGAVNDYDHYAYFSESQYKELFNELFSQCGLEFKCSEESRELFDGTDSQPFGVMVVVACTIIDKDTGIEETSYHTGIAIDRGDKAIYKAKTGALKSFFANTFWVATHDDPEIEDEHKAKVVRKAPAGSVTKGQLAMLKSLFKDGKDELKEIMKNYNKKKIEELTVSEASEIIDNKKGNNENE